MKTTMMFRPIANPRRTRLADLTDAEPQRQVEQSTQVARAEETEETEETQGRPLPQQTANPRRTVLSELPVGSAPAG
jgi:hypothetical protein